MLMRITSYIFATIGGLILIANSAAIWATDDLLELRCSYRGGVSNSFEREVDRVTINLASQSIKLWATKKNDGWQFANGGSDDIFPYKKEVTSLRLYKDGGVDGTGHNFFVSAAFRYSQKDGRLQWVWIAGAGNVSQMEFNCWRI